METTLLASGLENHTWPLVTRTSLLTSLYCPKIKPITAIPIDAPLILIFCTNRRTRLPSHQTKSMASEPANLQTLVQQYYKSDDEGREQLFENLYTSHYNGPSTAPDHLANLLKGFLLSLDLLPTIAGAETMYIVIIQELCWGMQRFCLFVPPGIDYVWNATTLFISLLGQMPIEPGGFDTHTFVADNLKYWIVEFASDDHCDMDNVTSSPVRDGDGSVISIPQDQWDKDSAEQLANLSQNREARKRCIVHKVIAARALRDGYAPPGPRSTAFSGACELRFIETALRCCRNDAVDRAGGRCENSGDVIAATFLLRACAKSLLECLPREGCEFHELWEMASVKAGEEGKVDRLGMWKEALERIVVGEQRAANGGFEMMGYAGLALDNLRDPRDETSEELFSWEKIVF